MSDLKEPNPSPTQEPSKETAGVPPECAQNARDPPPGIDSMKLPDDVNARSPKSSPKRLNKRASKRYWTVHFYNSEEATSKLTGLSVANCNPTSEHAAVPETKEVGKSVPGGTHCYNLHVYC